MANSTHKVEVVPLCLTKLEGSDFLSVAKVFDYECVTQTAQWEGRKLAAYIPPDSLVDTGRPEFAFLAAEAKADGRYRIRAKKIRGVRSFGLLVPAPEGVVEGDDVAELLGVTHYDPDIERQKSSGFAMGNEDSEGPPVFTVKYDVEAGRKYATKVFEPGEPVVVVEKAHGASSKYVYSNGRMYCGSRTQWKKEYADYSHVTIDYLCAQSTEMTKERAEAIIAKLNGKKQRKSLWWEALDNTPALRAFCEANPNYVVYGEVYGQVQDLKYQGGINFGAFDIMKDGKWLDWEESQKLRKQYDLPWLPIISEAMPFDFKTVSDLAEGPSLIPGAKNIREGVVVKTPVERYTHRIGRACLKFVGCGYLERAK